MRTSSGTSGSHAPQTELVRYLNCTYLHTKAQVRIEKACSYETGHKCPKQRQDATRRDFGAQTTLQKTENSAK